MDKVTKEYFDRAYWMDGTKSGYRCYGPNWGIHKAIAEMLWTCFVIKPGDKVLDYGGAFGYHAAKLQTHTGCRGFLVDASEYAIAHAAPTLRGRTYWLDVGESPLPFPSAYFDFCLSIEVMEHIYKPEVDFAIEELYRVLKPGVMVYASIDVIREGGAVNTETCNDLSHQTLEPVEFWISKFRKHGLEISSEATKLLKSFTCAAESEGAVPLGQRMKWTQLVLKKGPGK